MGLFDLFRRKKAPLQPKQAETPQFKQVETSPLGEVSWSVWPSDLADVRSALDREHAQATTAGLHLLIYSYESWSPGSVAFKQFGKHPLGVDLLRHVHVVEVSMATMDRLNEIGIKGFNIPQLWAIEADGQYRGKTTSGAIWGADTPENIFHALGKWFQSIGWG